MTGGMMFKGTPGPWEWKDDEKKFGYYRLAPGVLLSEESDGTPWGDSIDIANSRLIAAAPDLLEALQKIVKDLEMRAKNGIVDCSQGVYYEAHTAIAKALGEQK